MRILAISHLFPHEAERRYGIFVSRQLSAISRQGASVDVFVPRVFCPPLLRKLPRWKSYNHRSPLLPIDGLRTHVVPFLRIYGNWYNRWGGLAAYISMRRKGVALHRAEPFDVIYATSLFPNGDAAVRLAKTLQIPSACLMIGTDVNTTAQSTPALQHHFRNMEREFDGILACGASLVEYLLPTRRAKACVVYGVVDLDQFQPVVDKQSVRSELGLPAGTILLYVGYLWRTKGLFELLEAFSKLHARGSDTYLVICGHGPEADSLRHRAVELGIASHVIFVGGVDPDQIHRYMQSADLFVFPSYAEGMPNAVMEAMACGLPVVCTAVGGLPAALAGSLGARLVPPKDADALASQVDAVLASPERIREMGVAARELAERDFGAEINAKKIVSYLQGLTGSTNRQTSL